MARRILAALAAFAVLTFFSVAGAAAQPVNPCAAKQMQNPCVQKGQPAGTKSEKDPRDAVVKGTGLTASDLARQIAAYPSL